MNVQKIFLEGLVGEDPPGRLFQRIIPTEPVTLLRVAGG
jgi:hypothetical protein